MRIFPPTAHRVALHTRPDINGYIQSDTLRRCEQYRDADGQTLRGRLNELDREWDTERVTETGAGAFVLAGSLLGLLGGRRWALFTGAAGWFLLQHALVGWCPNLPLIRRLGVRTMEEIQLERDILEELLIQ